MPKNERQFSSLAMISAHGRIANWRGGEPYWSNAPLGHTLGFSGWPLVQSGPGDAINGQCRAIWPAFEKKNCAERLTLFSSPPPVPTERVSLLFPTMSSAVPVGALVGGMRVLPAKHIVADFFLQNSWMAFGKDQKTGGGLPLL